MERFDKSDYREQYPNLGNEIIDYIQKSDRKIEYQQYDLKVDQYRVDSEKETVHISQAVRIIMTAFWKKEINFRQYPKVSRIWQCGT